MAYGNTSRQYPEAEELRKQLGRILKDIRVKHDVRQKDVADRVGFDYYTAISSVETGRIRIPPDTIGEWAKAIGMRPEVLAQLSLAFGDPWTYHFLFGERVPKSLTADEVLRMKPLQPFSEIGGKADGKSSDGDGGERRVRSKARRITPPPV